VAVAFLKIMRAQHATAGPVDPGPPDDFRALESGRMKLELQPWLVSLHTLTEKVLGDLMPKF